MFFLEKPNVIQRSQLFKVVTNTMQLQNLARSFAKDVLLNESKQERIVGNLLLGRIISVQGKLIKNS